MTFRRARNAEQRELRREAILDVATEMLDDMPVGDVTLNELSRRVGLAKSNVLRYFESREAVLFELLERAMSTWLAGLPGELGDAADLSSPLGQRADGLAAALAASLARQTVLCDLINAQSNVLEHNVSVEVVLRHKRAAVANIEAAARLLQHHLPELGEGARTVAMMSLISAGALSSYCRPSDSALAAYEADPTVGLLSLDLRTSLEAVVATLIRGTLANPRTLGGLPDGRAT